VFTRTIVFGRYVYFSLSFDAEIIYITLKIVFFFYCLDVERKVRAYVGLSTSTVENSFARDIGHPGDPDMRPRRAIDRRRSARGTVVSR